MGGTLSANFAKLPLLGGVERRPIGAQMHLSLACVAVSVGSKFFECSENNYSFPEHIFARSAKKNFLLRSTKNVLRNTKNMLRSDPGAPKTCSGTQSHALSLSKFPGSLPNPTKSCSGAPHCSKTCSGADVTSGALPIGP